MRGDGVCRSRSERSRVFDARFGKTQFAGDGGVKRLKNRTQLRRRERLGEFREHGFDARGIDVPVHPARKLREPRRNLLQIFIFLSHESYLPELNSTNFSQSISPAAVQNFALKSVVNTFIIFPYSI